MLLPLWTGADISIVGIAFGLAAASCWAAYIVFGKRVAHLHSGQVVALGMTTAALLVVPIGVVDAGPAMLSIKIALLGLIAAVLSSALPFSLDMIALRHIPKRTFGVFVSAEPALGTLAGFVFLGEAISCLEIAGIILIMLAAGGAALANRQRSAD